MIHSVSLNRFKKFKESTIQLRPFSILMGENSSGKTSVLQAINLALSTFSSSDLIFSRNGDIHVKNRGVGATILPGVNISDFRELYYAKVSRQGRQAKIGDSKIGAQITLIDERENTYRLQVSSLFGGYNLKCLSSTEELANDPTIYQYTPLFISGFVGLQETEQRSFPVTIRHHLSSGNVSSIIRNLVLDLKKNNPNNYELLNARLIDDFGFHLGIVEFNEDRDEFVKASYRENCENRRLTLDFNSSGSGYMQILQILASIYSVCPNACKVVLLDEPDAHLHPNMQIALARSLKKIQRELDIQIIISTHSPAIIKTALPTEVIPISAINPINRPLTDAAEVTESIAQLDNYELAKSVISGRMIFIEDANTTIMEAFDKIAGTNVFHGTNTMSVHTGRSKDDKLPFQIKPVLKEFLGREIEIYFIRDSDGLSDVWKNELENYAEEKNIALHFLSLYEIENYILKPSLIRRALEQKYTDKPLPSEHEIEQKIIEALKSTITLAKYKYDDNLEDSIFKSGILLSKSAYRSQDRVRHEAESIRSSYEDLTSLDDLLRVGMGKQGLSIVFRWLNNDLHLNICKDDVLDALQIHDVPDEIISLFRKLHPETFADDDLDTLPSFLESETVPDTILQDLDIDENDQMQIE